ncbi:regucalcin-like [Contarinia nasturtii]|uniref:regucalcin-like n=1 Tax=Contarinia nasturtii TaxID=265458 RepID=UPI0012D402D6|nr:regucalcin-like [Contarinia nasturtii]
MIYLHHTIFLLIICAFSFGVEIEQLPSPRSLCGEGPHWDQATQSLYYIDIEGPEATILRYDYGENKTYGATVENVPLMTFVLPIENSIDEFLVGGQHTASVISWDGKSSKGEFVRNAFEVETDKYYDTNRFNDAKCDAAGRFYGGTQRKGSCGGPFTDVANASFYTFDHENGVKQLKQNVLISNGLTWVGDKFYYIDSCTHDIKEYDYNSVNGELSNERIIFTLRENGKVPEYIFDGMTSDVDGNLFIATYDDYKVMKINPKSGELLAEYKLPTGQVTSVAFGGPNLDILFVTTASRRTQQPEAGHLYKITGLETRGTSGVKVKL